MILPKEIKKIINKLEKNGFKAFAVGGCVRDYLMDREPKDWDIATNAKPKEIQEIFPDSFYKNKFGTVTVQTGSRKLNLKEIEITTYRIDEKYSDKRHPDKVKFAGNIKDDLSRRDFTINAIAFNGKEYVDSYRGAEDIKKRIIRCVGSPKERFSEDALRILRAVRFAAVLKFKIEEGTLREIKKNASWLRAISKERVRDELIKILESRHAKDGIVLLQETGLLKYIIPELETGIGIEQNKHHTYTVFEHNVLSLDWAAKNNYGLNVRLAALLHDVAKPQTKRGKGQNATFYGHEVIGAKITAQILQRLRFPKRIIEKVTLLVRYHLFYYNVDEVTEAAVRRLIRNVGLRNMKELMELRLCDRKGSGVPKAKPYKLRHLEYMIEKVSKEPLSLKMLKLKGDELMDILKIKPGPKIGKILNALLEEVLDDPKKNTKSTLKKRAMELAKLSDDELAILALRAFEKKELLVKAEEQKVKNKYWVK